jgi:sugar phosphate isomerase/epimerase
LPFPARYSICQLTTPHCTFEEDLRIFVEAGVSGFTVCESKLRSGEDDALFDVFQQSGLEAPIAITNCNSPLPAEPFFFGPRDLEQRVELMSAGLHRVARFGPQMAIVTTGKPPAGMTDGDRRAAIEGFRTAARVAGEMGMSLSLEPVRNDLGADVTFIRTLPETIELIEEIGEPNVNVCYDVYHMWDTPDVVEHTRRYADRIGCVHIADWKEPTRGWADRALPGEGAIDLPALLEALEQGGFDGWYDLEIFSDDTYEDSLWKLPPAQLLARARAGFERSWEVASARRVT